MEKNHTDGASLCLDSIEASLCLDMIEAWARSKRRCAWTLVDVGYQSLLHLFLKLLEIGEESGKE